MLLVLTVVIQHCIFVDSIDIHVVAILLQQMSTGIIHFGSLHFCINQY